MLLSVHHFILRSLCYAKIFFHSFLIMPYIRKRMRRSEAAKFRKAVPAYIPRVSRPIASRSNVSKVKHFKTILRSLNTDLGKEEQLYKIVIPAG